MNDKKLSDFFSGLVMLFMEAVIFQLLWNCIMPYLFSLPTINCWMAVGILLIIQMTYPYYLRVKV